MEPKTWHLPTFSEPKTCVTTTFSEGKFELYPFFAYDKRMKRDIYKRLIEWQNSPRRKPLIINGARQVGKTHALKHFGRSNFHNYTYLNFEKDEKLCEYFNNSLDPKELIRIIGIHTEIQIEPNKTLIIFDEIQNCPKALNSLKYFCEEANNYHVAAAGSLLGVKTAGDKGFPVGKVNFLNLYPLTFFEFLSALGQDQTRKFLEELNEFQPIPNPIHEKLIAFLKIYLFVGGMPEAAEEYIKSENLNVVREIQLEILNAYEKDFGKHAPIHDVMKITTVWKQIHQQLSKENKKFIFSAIRKSARGRDYEDSIQWLSDAGLIHKSYRIKTPKLPLSAYGDNNIFKILLLDVGLLGAQCNLSAHSLIEGNILFSEFKGSLTENYVTQEWIASTGQVPYYWTSEGKAELDFLTEIDNEIYPLEIKSGESKQKKSLLVYNDVYAPAKLLRTSTLNLKRDGNIYNCPLYLISQLSKLISIR